MPAHPAAIAAIAVTGLGLSGAGALWMSSSDRSPVFGDGIAIEVVAPIEPAPIEGPVLEVGEVIDGYEHRPYIQPAAYEPETAWLPEEDASLSEAEFRPARLEVPEQPNAAPQPEPEASPRSRSRWSFGFDSPLPDFAAERRARQARIEAMAAESIEASTPAPGPERIDPAARRSAEMFY